MELKAKDRVILGGLAQRISRRLDTLVRPSVRIGGRSWSAFKLCGYAGLALAILLTMALVAARGLSPWVMASITLAAMASFLTLAMVTKVVVGEERLVYYHHEIAVVLVTIVLVRLLGEPVLAYLDITILGVGVFLVCGRIGCLMVGCCHGRPHRWGVRYRQEHVSAGFNPHYLWARLIPVQAVESCWVAGVVLIGCALVLTDQQAGSAFAWYVIAYDVGRFCLEFLRGDPARPYVRGFSGAQWISVGLILIVVGLEVGDVLPATVWHLAAAAALIATMIGLAVRRRHDRLRFALRLPRHVREVASALDFLESTGDMTLRRGMPVVNVATTSLGIRISSGTMRDDVGRLDHFTISRDGDITVETARTVAELIAGLRGQSDRGELIEGRGAYHLLIRAVA